MKKLCGMQKPVLALPNPDNIPLEELANKINDEFLSVMQDYDPITNDQRLPSYDDQPIHVNPSEVLSKLSQLQANKASGPDDVSSWVLNKFAAILAAPISSILNCSFNEETVPTNWKRANVITIPKTKPVKDIIKDLRPISLTPVISKVAEEFIIEKDLKQAILSVIDSNQYGGIEKSSACMALISMIHQWSKATDGNGASVRVTLFDFRKAFDLVDHNILLNKLKTLDIKPSVVNWIVDFLTNRQQRIKITDNLFSQWRHVPAGVPQGSKLGPWLFLLMINDLKAHPSFNLWKFIDDTSFSEVVSKSLPSLIQPVVDQMQSWSDHNRFELHPTKSKELRIEFSKQPRSFNPIKVDNKDLEVVKTVKILGLVVSNDLKWNAHVDSVLSKSSKRLYFLVQLKRAGVPEKQLCLFYTTCIRSVIEYACQVYHYALPEYLSDDLERLQRRALRIIHPFLSYSQAMITAGLTTLRERRRILCEKLFKNIVSDPTHKLHSLLPPKNLNPYNLRSNSPFSIPFSKTNRFKNCFINASISNF